MPGGAANSICSSRLIDAASNGEDVSATRLLPRERPPPERPPAEAANETLRDLEELLRCGSAFSSGEVVERDDADCGLADFGLVEGVARYAGFERSAHFFSELRVLLRVAISAQEEQRTTSFCASASFFEQSSISSIYRVLLLVQCSRSPTRLYCTRT